MSEKEKRKALKKFKAYEKYLSKEDYLASRDLFEELLFNEVVSKENISHCYNRIFPMIAIYKVLKERERDPLEKTRDIFNYKEVYQGARFLKKIIKIPYFYLLVPRLILKTVKKSYRESSDGFQIEVVKATHNVCRFNIKQCTYYKYCKKLKVPELCDIFCSSDDISGEALKPNIIFKRANTLSRGGKYCDFSYHINNQEDV